MIDVRRRWGQWRVYYITEEVPTSYLPASLTDAGSKDPFVEQAQGRAIARIGDLLELTKIIGGLVKEIRPKL